MEINGALSSSMAARVGLTIAARQPSSPNSAQPRSPRLSPTCDSYLANDFSFEASFSGRQLPAHTVSPKSNAGRKRNLSLQVGAFYSEQAGGAASTATCEEDERRSRSPVADTQDSKRNFYDVLGVAQDASVKDIRAAYRGKALEFHPDLASPHEKELFTEIFAQMNEAYSTLSDPHSRTLYDAKLSYLGQKTAPHVPGFNSYAYNFTGFKTDIWARNAGVKSESMSARESRTSPRAPASSISATDSISSRWRGSNWETDQCWC